MAEALTKCESKTEINDCELWCECICGLCQAVSVEKDITQLWGISLFFWVTLHPKFTIKFFFVRKNIFCGHVLLFWLDLKKFGVMNFQNFEARKKYLLNICVYFIIKIICSQIFYDFFPAFQWDILDIFRLFFKKKYFIFNLELFLLIFFLMKNLCISIRVMFIKC